MTDAAMYLADAFVTSMDGAMNGFMKGIAIGIGLALTNAYLVRFKR